MTKQLPLYAIIFISGAAVLATEIVGTRVLGPYYGVSLFLWSALITVTLAALSLGYALGGRWADRRPGYFNLALILAGAGLWLLLTPWMKRPILEILDPTGLRVAVLTASFALFFVPLALLGMVSPYAVRLRAHSLTEVGTAAGNVYAISTIASVVAALLTGFILIPNMGVNRLISLIGLGLLVGAAIALLAGRGTARGATLLLFASFAGGGLLAWKTPEVRADPEKGLVAVRQSPYAEIRVADFRGLRFLLIDGGTHTIVDPETWDSHHRYVLVLDTVKLMFEDPGDMLLVGLGGGSVAKTFSRSGWSVDAVEIDPVVNRVAHDFFGLDSSEARVHLMDARRYLLTRDRRFDLVVMDAFGSSAIPFHLITREYFGLVKSRMNPGGIFAINLESIGWRGNIVRSTAATLGIHFANVVALPTQEPPNTIGNVVLLASDRPMEIPGSGLPHPKDFLDDPYDHWTVIQMNHGWDNRFDPREDPGMILTDDRNPVDVWAEAINLDAREDLHEYFGNQGIDW